MATGEATDPLGSPYLEKLTELELGGIEIDHHLSVFFQMARCATSLRTLDLDSVTFQPGAFEEFTRSKFSSLRWLRLNSVDLRLPAATQLADAPFTSALEEMYLDNCQLGGGVSNVLYQGRHPKLATLDLSRNRLERFGAEGFVTAAKNSPALTNLRLWDNRLGPNAVVHLAASKLLANLTDLDLSGNNIGVVGALALASSKYLKRLTSLVVDEKTVTQKGKKELIDRFGESVVSFR